jgi:hypothetical protein
MLEDSSDSNEDEEDEEADEEGAWTSMISSEMNKWCNWNKSQIKKNILSSILYK